MANSHTVQITNDGPRNVTLLLNGIVDTPPQTSFTLVDPALLNNDPRDGINQLRIDTFDYIVDDGLYITLSWDATSAVPFTSIYGRGNWNLGKSEGGLQNNAGTGKTGKILAVSNTPTAGTYSYSIWIWLTKQAV